MHLIKSFALYSLVGVIFFLASCSKKQEKTGEIDEGYIEYKMEYMGDSLDAFVQTFLPKRMKIIFKNNNTKNEISDPTGMVAFTHIKDYNNRIHTTLVDVMKHKYKYREDLSEKSIFYQTRPNIKISRQDTMKNIAGYSCRKAEITYPTADNENVRFNIYYTDKINIKGFTDLTPFQEIDGVLLEFQLEIYQIPMRLVATKVQQKEISPEEFSIPSDYKRVNKKTMQEIIELLKER